MEHSREIKKTGKVSKLTLSYSSGIREYKDNSSDITRLHKDLLDDANKYIDNVNTLEYIRLNIERINSLEDALHYCKNNKYYKYPVVKKVEYAKEKERCK